VMVLVCSPLFMRTLLVLVVASSIRERGRRLLLRVSRLRFRQAQADALAAREP